jgi:hypothetical protein
MRTATRTPLTRAARAVVVAAALTATLPGCAVEVAGTGAPWHGAPRAVFPVEAPPPTTAPTAPRRAPRFTAPSALVNSINPAVYAEWIASGWTPTSLQPAQDPDTLTSVEMFGPSLSAPTSGANGVSGVSFESAGAPASAGSAFTVVRFSTGYAPDAEATVTNTARRLDWRVAAQRQVSVSGHPGLDVRFEGVDRNGRPIVNLSRYVELPQHLLVIETGGLATDARIIGQVQEIIVPTLRLPGV